MGTIDWGIRHFHGYDTSLGDTSLIFLETRILRGSDHLMAHKLKEFNSD